MNRVTEGSGSFHSEVALLKVLEEEGECDSFFTVVSDGEAGGSLDLDSVTLGIVFAVTEPLTEILTGVDGEKRDTGAFGESLDNNNN